MVVFPVHPSLISLIAAVMPIDLRKLRTLDCKGFRGTIDLEKYVTGECLSALSNSALCDFATVSQNQTGAGIRRPPRGG